jgi:hypothetical protein
LKLTTRKELYELEAAPSLPGDLKTKLEALRLLIKHEGFSKARRPASGELPAQTAGQQASSFLKDNREQASRVWRASTMVRGDQDALQR